jgi:hypothetical protein
MQDAARVFKAVTNEHDAMTANRVEATRKALMPLRFNFVFASEHKQLRSRD